MIESFLIILIIGLIIISMVLAYNVYVENQYRKKMYQQFGNSNNDALLDAKQAQVRDGQDFNIGGVGDDPLYNANVDIGSKIFSDVASDLIVSENLVSSQIDTKVEDSNEIKINSNLASSNEISNSDKATLFFKNNPNLLLNLVDLEKIELPWFNKKFDYMAYISLKKPRELVSIPRLINKHRFTIVGCTMDNKFQIAEPIPSVLYKGFVIGLQAISRNGLTTSLELQNFGEKSEEFARKMGGVLLLTDINKFLKVAKVLDDLCAKVDQIITLNLISKSFVSGIELKNALEKNEFELSSDGAFYYPNSDECIFRAINLDEEPFTLESLSTKQYKGFSLLFDITHVPPGEKYFNKFMELAVKLSNIIGLDLVDCESEPLSTQWLKNIEAYVLERQEEMKSVGIIPGRELANRIFK